MQPKIGIILTTFLRDDLLLQSVCSIMNNWQSDWQLIIVDQNPTEDKVHAYCHSSYIAAPYNCGLSHARNLGVQEAQRLGCEYCIVTADSIKFNSSMRRINEIFPLFEEHPYLGRIGFKLEKRINWEGWLNLEEDFFTLELIDTKQQGIYDCNCIKNFFIAKTASLLDVPWDNTLKMAEHEDWQYRYGKCWDTLYCNFYTGEYIGIKEGSYATYRQENWNEGLKNLLNKYSIKQWITYKNPELFDRSAQ